MASVTDYFQAQPKELQRYLQAANNLDDATMRQGVRLSVDKLGCSALVQDA